MKKTAKRMDVEFNKLSHRLSVHAQETNTGHDYQQMVEKKAYEIYENRGRVDGNDLEDWLQAEKWVKDLGQ